MRTLILEQTIAREFEVRVSEDEYAAVLAYRERKSTDEQDRLVNELLRRARASDPSEQTLCAEYVWDADAVDRVDALLDFDY